MALRSGYKGFKKLLPGLKLFRPGTLGIDNDVLIPELNKIFFPRSEQEVLGAKNLLNPELLTGGNDVLYSPIYVGDGTFTLSTTAPQSAQDAANLFFLPGNVDTGISTAANGVWNNRAVTINSVDGYVTVASRGINDLDVREYNNQLEIGDHKTNYVPYAKTNRQLTLDTYFHASTISYETGVTQNEPSVNPVHKFGKVCVINIDLTGAEGNASTWINLGTLPEGYRPGNNSSLTAIINGKTSVLDCAVQTTGNLRIRNNSGAVSSSDIIHINGVFVV